MPDFTRTSLLIGEDKLNILKKSSVAVFGIGGVGSYTIEALARCGVGRLMIVDNDTITLVYAIGPICIARNVKNCWSIVTIPNAKPSQSENDEIVLTPPQSQSTAVATAPVAMLKNRISFCFTSVSKLFLSSAFRFETLSF